MAAPLGSFAPPAAAASARRSIGSAGVVITHPCHQPEPVGASGSYTLTAKLLVSLGAPLHLSAGDLFSPEQPKPLNSNFLSIIAVGLRSGLSSFMAACAIGAAAMSAAAIRVRIMGIS